MAAVISLVMMGLGFMNGMVITTLIERNESARLNALLEKTLEQKFNLEKELDSLKEELEYERDEKDELVSKLGSLVRQYSNLPPPCEKLERCELYYDSDSDDEEFECPTSPTEKLDNKD